MLELMAVSPRGGQTEHGTSPYRFPSRDGAWQRFFTATSLNNHHSYQNRTFKRSERL